MSDAPSARWEWIRSAIEEYQGRLIRFAARITGDLDSARDVVQETFLRLCREDPERIRDHLAAWLFTVCRNRALDVHKKEAPLMPLDDAGAAALEARPKDPCSAVVVDPYSAVEARESAGRILALLSELPASQQEVLRLRFQEDLSYKEISAVTRHSVGNVGLLIHTGLKRLRERLSTSAPPQKTEGGRTHA